MEGGNWDLEIIPGANRVKRIAEGVGKLLRLGHETELCLSEHNRPPLEGIPLEFFEDCEQLKLFED